MGVHKLSRLENYWSSDPLLGVNAISDVVSSKRFKKITQALHINDNSAYPPPPVIVLIMTNYTILDLS